MTRVPPARLAGLLSLIVVATGAFAESYVRGTLIVSGDAAATAANIAASEQLWRLGLAAQLVNHAFNIGATVILYEVFKPVSRSLSFLGVLFSFLGTAIWATGAIDHAAPLALLAGSPAFTPAQTQALAHIFLKLMGVGYDIALVFFGLYCVVIGALIVGSTFLPRILGVLMGIAGLCFVANSFAIILAPDLARQLVPYILVPPLVAQALFILWLTIAGINTGKWQALTASR